MVYQWEPGTPYGQGTVVEYQGHQYKIIQAHTSQADWTPPSTPALWARLTEPIQCQPSYGAQQQQPFQPQGGSFGGSVQPWQENDSQKADVRQEEHKKHWYDLDDKRKKELEVGGGLVAGLGALAAGYYAHHVHDKNEEKKKLQDLGFQKWVRDAQAKAEEFYRMGPQGPVTWILANGKNIPQGAILGGEADGQPIFIARAYVEGGIQVGKAGPQFEKGAVIGFRHKEIQFQVYEVLIGDPRAIRWVNTSGHLRPAELGCRLVEGGYEDDGSLLYIAQANHKGRVCPGKASEALDGAYIPYGGDEKREKVYRVLAYA